MRSILIAKQHNSRLPNKHYIEVAGKAIIHWAVADALRVPSAVVVIATDSPELNDFARAGAPETERDRVHTLLRPRRLSAPSCSAWEPFFWAMQETEDLAPGPALLVQGSVPVRPPWLLPEAASILARPTAPHLVLSAYCHWRSGHAVCYHVDGGVYGVSSVATDERAVKNRAVQAYLETKPGDCIDVDVAEDLDAVRPILESRASA